VIDARFLSIPNHPELHEANEYNVNVGPVFSLFYGGSLGTNHSQRMYRLYAILLGW
jgi:hypothetical protein